jgi:hypothetical protein
MNDYYSDKKTIQLAMLLLFLSLLVIYVLLFAINWEKIKESAGVPVTNEIITYPWEITSTQTDTSNPTISSPDISISDSIANTTNSYASSGIDKENEMEALSAEVTGISPWTSNDFGFNDNTSINTWEEKTLDKQDDIYILTGTEKYFGPIKIVEKLGIDYAYALKDQKDIYYIFLGRQDYDFDQIARQLGGNTYKINTEQEILENKLFGESITYINIPEYKDDTVILLAKVNDVQRLIQIDYSIYHESKGHLRSIFGF